jgi:hypothetical protein
MAELIMGPEPSLDDLPSLPVADEDPDQVHLDTLLQLQFSHLQEHTGMVSRDAASAQDGLVATGPLSQHCKTGMDDPPVISMAEAALERAKQWAGLDLPDLCDSCLKFLSEGDELATRIQAERLSNEVKQQTGEQHSRALPAAITAANMSQSDSWRPAVLSRDSVANGNTVTQ